MIGRGGKKGGGLPPLPSRSHSSDDAETPIERKPMREIEPEEVEAPASGEGHEQVHDREHENLHSN